MSELCVAGESLSRGLAEKQTRCEELEARLDETTRALDQFKLEMAELVRSSKAECETTADELRERLAHVSGKYAQAAAQLDAAALWQVERDDLTQQREHMQTELHGYMQRLSELQCHKENVEMELRGKCGEMEERVRSALALVHEKEVL